jgi:RNA polymerase sigma factor (sigma-70 family)
MTTDRTEPIPDQDDHAETVAAAARGDERAWRRLVHRYKRLVYSIPRGYRLGEEACEDVFQNVFVALVRELPKLSDARALPKWLITTTHRECWRANRRARPGSLAMEVESEELDPAQGADWEARQRLEEGLSALGGRCEKLLRMLYLTPAQVPYERVGEVLGMPVGSIGPTRSRCLAKLAELLPDLADRAGA